MKKTIISIVLLMLCMNFVYASTQLSVELLNQDPDPAGSGELVKLRFNAANLGKEVIKDLEVELLPTYPFEKVDTENYFRQIEVLAGYPSVIKYWVRVNKEAVEQTYEMDIQFRSRIDQVWSKKTFEIDVDDVKTDFDLVIQEINENEVSIAIANVGKNVAYSTIVRIPKQENFRTIGTDGQMIGNLDDGDYTLVVFELAKQKNAEDLLEIKIDYTDNIGERRSLTKEIRVFTGVSSASPLGSGTANLAELRMMRQGLQSIPIYQKWWFWVIIIVLFVVGSKFYKKTKNKKLMQKQKKR